MAQTWARNCQGKPIRGSRHTKVPSLTPDQQQEARERIDAGETQRSVAHSYNVSQATISRLSA